MGTRAAFWVGNPCENGELLGCIAFDGYPDGLSWLDYAGDETGWREVVKLEAAQRDDWTPAEDGFPFPWTGDLFLTDWNYSWFDGALHAACFHSGWVKLPELIEWAEVGYNDDESPFNNCRDTFGKIPVPVPRSKPGEGRDSILIITTGG
jgi:hypothetical protein